MLCCAVGFIVNNVVFVICFSAAECKIIYKSIRDSLRYQQKKVILKSGDSGDEANSDDQTKRDVDLDSFAFLTPTSAKFPRKTIVLGGAAKPTATSTAISTPSATEVNDWTPDDESESNSNASVYSYESKSKKSKFDAVENSLASMTKAFSSFVEKKAMDSSGPKTSAQPELKFIYIWQNLDQLFQQLPQADVNELNMMYMSQAYEKIKTHSQQT